jgi:hypothetical protein
MGFPSSNLEKRITSAQSRTNVRNAEAQSTQREEGKRKKLHRFFFRCVFWEGLPKRELEIRIKGFP